ncbi:hypothetical protein MY04_2194 [Flammeovirga sp. MY04]|uniref:hypothetical protein n=1 Tax=Flammeovirga sp. MY04 TaxID=1191459 RepID=UPI00080618A9|nr:hypothetical protein [Flammeovirga sp. MY04]ANQ49568.1 hypothetical protein MY04_2194 [Flammeovirga sp. MY04]
MRLFNLLLTTTLLLGLLSCNSEESEPAIENPIEERNGYNMLLIGNSFFKPYANHLDTMAKQAGFEDHQATVVFRGGENGQPINFWNDDASEEHLLIKSTLDEGNVEIFGMTSGHDYENTEDRIIGHRAWIEYALQANPDVTIFIAIPTLDFPQEWDQLVLEYEADSIQEVYSYFVNDVVHHEMVDQLRREFPSTNIFTIPTGWATINLAQKNLDNQLLDEISMMGAKETSIFTDQKGHQGQIVIETGTLVWLNSLYQVDLTTNTFDTGFNTNLHEIAKQIMDNHDPDYLK